MHATHMAMFVSALVRRGLARSGQGTWYVRASRIHCSRCGHTDRAQATLQMRVGILQMALAFSSTFRAAQTLKRSYMRLQHCYYFLVASLN